MTAPSPSTSPPDQPSSASPALPVPTVRRLRAGGFLRWVGAALCLCACGLLSLWTFGRLVSDRWLYSQYIAWIPTWTLILPALVLVLLGLPARRRRADGSRAWVIGSLYTLSALWAVLAVFHFTFVEHRLHRAVLRPAAPSASAVRLFQWNAQMPDAELLEGGYSALGTRFGRVPDVFCITTAQSYPSMERSAATLKTAGYELAYTAPFAVWSRFKILYAEFIPLYMNRRGGPTEVLPDGQASPDSVDSSIRRPARNRLVRYWNTYAPMFGIPPRRFPQGESGYVMVATLDTTAELGRPITVWFIDLPSDPFVFRWEIAKFARERFEEMRTQTNPRTGTALLPDADVILGDTNIPRGSASLGLLTGGDMHHAFDDAGWGLSATWPRAFPMFHLDHTFLAPWLKATAYRVGEPPVSDHWFQVVDVERR